MSHGSPRSSTDSLLRSVVSSVVRDARPLPSEGARLGRFLLERRLGHGAAGAVYAARDEVLGREVAVKVLVREASPEARARLFAEARAAARVDHPGIARVYDAAEIDGRLVLVMELVRGTTLRETLRQAGGRLSAGSAVAIVAAIADAAAAAHASGIVHRDLKPENVMIEESSGVKVLDFGLAAALEPAGVSPGEGFVGTPGYAAPETRASGASPRSDQYSLAVMLVEAIAGRRAPSIDELDAPRALCRVASRALSRSPDRRFADCATFARALRRATGGARPSGWLGAAAAIGFTTTLSLAAAPGHRHDATVIVSHQPAPRVPGSIACPPLATSPEDRWLGAAAASLVCRRSRALLGGGNGRALPPAMLLDLPRVPSPDLEADPYQAEGARERALEAAESSGHVVLDGEVAREARGFSVSLRASFEGVVVASGSATGDLATATARAVDELFASGSPAVAREPDAEAARWRGTPTVAALERISFAEAALATSGALAPALAGLESARDQSPSESLLVARIGAGLGRRTEAPRVALDTSSAEALARTAGAHVLLGGEKAVELAEAVRRARDAEPSEIGRHHLLVVEATLRLAAGDRDQARILALAAALEKPWDAPWSVLAVATYGKPEMGPVARAYAAWRPETADAWNILAHVDATEPERLAVMRRAYDLGDGFPLYAGNYGAWLLVAGRRDEAAAVAARLELGTVAQRVAGARLKTDIVLSEGRVRDAYATAWSGLERMDRVGAIETGDVALLGSFVELGVLLGDGGDAARRVFERFVAPEPPRIDRGPFARGAIAHACAYAEAEIAGRCFERLDRLTQSGYFPLGATGDADAYVAGARAFAAGDASGAARELRRIKSDLGVRASVAALALERAGELELADAVDPPRPGIFGGVSMSYARAARRAEKRGDCARATSLAERLLAAWRRADTPLGILGEMQDLVVRCRARAR